MLVLLYLKLKEYCNTKLFTAAPPFFIKSPCKIHNLKTSTSNLLRNQQLFYSIKILKVLAPV